jgi:hypothetical protein
MSGACVGYVCRVDVTVLYLLQSGEKEVERSREDLLVVLVYSNGVSSY